MKRIVVLLIAIVIVTGFVNVVGAEDWYVLQGGKCERMSQEFTLDMNILSCDTYKESKLNSPSDVIKCIRSQGMEYAIRDKTVNGKVVEVTINSEWFDGSGYGHTYYRLSRCQEVAEKLRKSKRDELDRYK
jgi:hypothetical protein